ncbi:MAG TPA: HNH endonuclease signature motif containing protein [Candidatus Eisenbacteria bacterium]|jgi:5-methylcytosine-specific restriction endonuclease McrA
MNGCKDPFATSHFSNDALLLDTRAWVKSERTSTAVLLSRLAEIDERKLYLGLGYSSLSAFCVHELRLSEDSAGKRIHVARLARRFPDILVEIYEGRLHLTAVQILAPHLRSGNADDLLVEARNKTKTELELMLARRFPKPDEPDRLEAIAAPSPALISEFLSGPAREHALEHVQATMPHGPSHGYFGMPNSDAVGQHAPEHVEASVAGPTRQHALEHVEPPVPRGRLTPLSPGRYRFGGTWDQEGYELYNDFRALVSHEVPSGELSQVLKEAVRIAKAEVEKRRFGATSCPGHSRPTQSARRIPAAVRRAVYERDGGRCAFVSDAGKRCDATRFLQFDHIEPVARGGEATVENLRLVCSAHNRYAAERAFGVEFMSRKREEGQRARAQSRAPTHSRSAGRAGPSA